MMRKHEGQCAAAMAALSALTYGVMESVPTWHVWEPTVGQFLVGSLMGLLAQRSWRKHKEERDRVSHEQTDPGPVGLQTPTIDESYCQSCDDVHPTSEFSLDVLGRWVCLECRRLVDPDYQQPKATENASEPEDDENSQPCDFCHEVSHRFIRLDDGHDVHVCQECLEHLRPADAQRAERKQKLTHADMLEETRKRLDAAEKKPARKGKSVEVAGGEYVRSMSGHQVVVNGVDKGGIVKVDGMNCRVKVSKDVLALGRVIADGMGAEIFIAGDVGQGAKIRAEGMNARIVILGHIGPEAEIRADGMNARIEYGGLDSRGTTIQARGMNSTVVRKGVVRDSTFDVWPDSVKESPEPKSDASKPPCDVCGAQSYYYMLIPPQGDGHAAHGEYRCVRCAGSVRNYTPDEQNALQAQARQDEINHLAAIYQVPAPQVGISPEGQQLEQQRLEDVGRMVNRQLEVADMFKHRFLPDDPGTL